MILANFKLNVHSTAEIQHEIDLKIYTRADSVGELDAEDVQRHGEVHRQPQVRRHIGDSTPDVNVIRAVTTVVCVAGGISSPVADLVGRTI